MVSASRAEWYYPTMRSLLVCAAACLALVACGGDDDGAGTSAKPTVNPAPPGEPWETLGEWHLFDDATAQEPNARVEPFEVISPLWSDGALKYRFLHLPEGSLIGYENEERWQLPVGSILVKTFAFPVDERDPALGRRLIETRLLVHEPDAWVPHTYIWNDEQTSAKRQPAGATVAVSYVDETGAQKSQDYGIPNTNQCHDCHGVGDELDTLGGRTRQLDRDGQIEHFAALGWLDEAPPVQREKLIDPAGSGSVVERARSYLDANCGHCHSAGGGAAQSGTLFSWTDTQEGVDPKIYGVCKVPTSAGGGTCGLVHDIVPGKPDESVLVCRISSRESAVQMPPLATRVVDEDGVSLLSEWISSLTLPACP
jgi:uncharacterized repeat protein (TIGR03806 family)